MSKLRPIILLVVFGILNLNMPRSIIAQPAPPNDPGAPGPGRRGPDGREPPPPPEQRLQATLQSLMGSNQQEWDVLRPKIEHIQLLLKQRERVTHPHPPKPPPPDRPDPNGPPPPPDLSPEMAAASTLTDVGPDPAKDVTPGSINATLVQVYLRMAVLVTSPSPNPDQVRSAIQEFHLAMAKSDAELADARKELRQVVTTGQEAILIVTGILD